jgi:hypothetical protein
MITIDTHVTRTTDEEVEFGASGSVVMSDATVFDTVEEAVSFLSHLGVTEPSAYPVTGNEEHVWFSGGDYQHPAEGWREETTAHRGEGTPEAVWAEVVKGVARG